MSSLDFDLDDKMSELELEWRQAYEASIAARTEYQASVAATKKNVTVVAAARDRLDRAEALNARIMAKIEDLEIAIIGGA